MSARRAWGWLVALAVGSSPGCTQYCAIDTTCTPGTRQWAEHGACLPTDPCASDDPCAAQHRICLGVQGHAQCGRCLDDWQGEDVCTLVEVAYVGPYRVTRDHFAVWDGTRYRPLFLRGVDVGGARPGQTADETSLTVADWTRWMTIWADAGLDVLRVYRAHDPPLYEALIAWNEAHPDQPIYLLQGVYLRDIEPGQTEDLFPRAERFDADVADAIDAVHGAREGYPDASAWCMGWLVGREVSSSEVDTTNGMHPEVTAYTGTALSVSSVAASEAWVVERLDRAVVYERAHYGTERPIGFTSWLELDPITHPTEAPASHQDTSTLDLRHVDASAAPAGHFVSYHAYPYFPDFVNEDPVYVQYADALGRDPYRGMIADLRRAHDGQALLISEFGVPTAFAPAHPAISGMSQGGITEEQQGVYAARMMRDIEEVGAAGGIWFQWEDGWWKRSWTSDNRAFPRDHFPLWHDLLNPEQGYGLMAFAPETSAWERLETTAEGTGRVRAVWAAYDAERVHFRIDLDAPLTSGDTMVVGLDVLDRTRGEPTLPDGTALVTTAPELAITIAPDVTTATMRVTPCLDLVELPRDLLYNASPRTRAGGCGGWATMGWLFSAFHYQRSGCRASDQVYPLGDLPMRDALAAPGSLDAVVVDRSAASPSVRLDLPWALVLVTDPTTRSVFDDDPTMTMAQASVTDGVALGVALDGELVETAPYLWPGWTSAPPTTERLKAGAETFFAYTRTLSRWSE